MAEKRKEDETTEEKGFTVTDKRRSGKDRPEAAPKAERKAAPPPPPPPEAEAPGGQEPPAEGEFPPADFQYLVLFLATQALLCLGEQPDPATGQKIKNLPGAKHAIDLMSVIQEKTKGNLSEDEAQLLESLLYDVRMRYVKATQAPPSS